MKNLLILLFYTDLIQKTTQLFKSHYLSNYLGVSSVHEKFDIWTGPKVSLAHGHISLPDVLSLPVCLIPQTTTNKMCR